MQANLDEEEEAVKHYSRALDITQELLTVCDNDGKKQILDNAFVSYLHERAKSYQAMSKLEDALSDFNEVIKRSPLNANAYFRRAFVYKMMSKLDAASEDFEKSKQLEPDNPYVTNVNVNLTSRFKLIQHIKILNKT